MEPPHPLSSAGRPIVARDFPKNHPPPPAAAGTRSDERTTAYYNPITGEETAAHRRRVGSLQRWDAEENDDDQEGSAPATLSPGVSGGVGHDAGKIARPNPDQPSATKMIKSAELGSELQDSDGVAPPAAPPSDPRTVARGDENEGKVVAARSEADNCRGASEDDDDEDVVASAGAFEELVMAEMERLRLEYSRATAEAKAKNDNDAAPPSSSNNHHDGQQQVQSITPLLGRDDEKELATRRQKAKEYGALLRLQMEQDRLKRKAEGSRSRNDGGFLPATRSTSASTDYEDGNAHNRANPSTDGTSNGDVTSRSYGEQEAVEYRRQLDEQVATKASGRHPVHGSNSRAVGVTETTMAVGTMSDQSGFDSANTVSVGQSASLPYGQDKSNEKRSKEEYARQLREQMDADIARRIQRHDGDQTLESLRISSVLAPSWHFAEDREAEERQQRRDAALEQQRLLELQIKEHNEAKARKKKEEDEALVPSPDECHLLDAESIFVPASSPSSIKRNPSKDPNTSTSLPPKDTNICSVRSPVIRRGRGGESFTVTLDNANGNGAGTSGERSMVPLNASTTEAISRAASRKRIQSSSHSRISEPKPETSTTLPPLKSPMVTSEGSQCGLADEDEDEDNVLVKDILRSALRRIENNVPKNGEGSNTEGLQSLQMHVLSDIKRSDLCLPKEANENNISTGEATEHSGRGQQSFAPSSVHVHESHRSNIDLEDFGEYLDDGEEAEEERLRLALSRIRNTMDTSLTS